MEIDFIWNYLIQKINNPYGVAGLMGNLYAESGLNPQNLQNNFEKKLGMSDIQYTQAVDDDSYHNFVTDSAGYGLAQWTYWTRKQNLLNFAKSKKCSIGSCSMQLDFLYQELTTSYPQVLKTLETANSILEASNVILLQFERPANQSQAVQEKRASYGQTIYNKYIKENKEATMNSPLVSYTKLSPNHSGQRTHAVDYITPHCVVGQLSVETLGNIFSSPQQQASCQYGIGSDGRVGMYVEEKNRSWCSSSNTNDQRAITIECASDTAPPYAFNNVVYNKLIELCVDICQRYGKTKLLWLGNKEKTLAHTPAPDEMILTVHRWYASKSCPGNWMYSRMGDLAFKVTSCLNGTKAMAINSNIEEEEEDMTQEKFNQMMNTYLNTLAEKDTTWAKDYLDWAKNSGIMLGDNSGNMMPLKFCTRQEAIVMMKRLYDLINHEKE